MIGIHSKKEKGKPRSFRLDNLPDIPGTDAGRMPGQRSYVKGFVLHEGAGVHNMRFKQIEREYVRTVQLVVAKHHTDDTAAMWIAFIDAVMTSLEWPEELWGPGLSKYDALVNLINLDEESQFYWGKLTVKCRPDQDPDLIPFGVRYLQNQKQFLVIVGGGHELGRFSALSDKNAANTIRNAAQHIEKCLIESAPSAARLLEI